MILIVGGAFQGKRTFAEKLASEKTYTIINDFHNQIRTLLEHEENVEAYLCKLLAEDKNVIVTMDEVGSGVVPMESFDRRYRDAVGKAGQYLAKEADAVYRVVCGIGVRIK